MFTLQSLFSNFIFISIITVIIGLGLASIFGVECNKKDRDCNVYYPPDVDQLHDKTLQWNNECYLFEKKDVSCPLTDTPNKHVIGEI